MHTVCHILQYVKKQSKDDRQNSFFFLCEHCDLSQSNTMCSVCRLSYSAKITGHSETRQGGQRVITYFNNVRHAGSRHDHLFTSPPHDRPANTVFRGRLNQVY